MIYGLVTLLHYLHFIQVTNPFINYCYCCCCYCYYYYYHYGYCYCYNKKEVNALNNNTLYNNIKAEIYEVSRTFKEYHWGWDFENNVTFSVLKVWKHKRISFSPSLKSKTNEKTMKTSLAVSSMLTKELSCKTLYISVMSGFIAWRVAATLI